MELHESINGLVIPIENIDYIGGIECTFQWGFKVQLKSGCVVWIGRNDVREYMADDRRKLIEKLKNYTSNKTT